MSATPTGLAVPRSIALRVIVGLVALSTAVAFGESYRALYLWAAHHDVPIAWAFLWPAMVDVFVAVGELALFVGMADQWETRHRLWAWAVTAGGLAVSVAGNIGHVGSAQWTDRLTAAVPPVAAFVALTVGLGVLKRVVERQYAPQSDTARAVLEYAPETLADMTTLADAIRFGMLEVARGRNTDIAALTGREIAEWLEAHKAELADPAWNVTPSYVADVLRRTMQARERQAGNVTRLRQSA